MPDPLPSSGAATRQVMTLNETLERQSSIHDNAYTALEDAYRRGTVGELVLRGIGIYSPAR